MKTGTDILDLAAAPGGKSLVMTARGARVVSNDVSPSRLRPLMGQSRRIVVSDGRRAAFRGRFQTVLVDAPCSATGTIRKNPEIKWRMREEDIGRFVPLQKELLAAALELAEETVVYSTCSLEPEENDGVITAVGKPFERVDAAQFVNANVARWVEGGVLHLTPESGTDGFTAFVLKRSR